MRVIRAFLRLSRLQSGGDRRTPGRFAHVLPVTIAIASLLMGNFCRAGDAPSAERRMENRFLFVIDTSSSMRARTNGIVRGVASLLESDMRGEFRKGDTIGVWTYDEKIHTDMPMLVWDKEKKESITSDVIRYLDHQRYEGHSHLDKVLSSIGQVLEQSERLTVILIHDGSERIRGTEFDTDLNDLQKKYARSFRSAHVPMITVLVARGGVVYDYTINYPDSINIPHTALPEPPPEAAQTNAPAVAVVPPPVTNLPPAAPAPTPRHIEIIMSGTNHLAHEATTLETALSATNDVVMAGPRQSQPPPVAIPAPVVSNPPPTATASEPAPTKPEPAAPEPATVVAQSASAPVVTSAPPKTVAAPVPSPSAAPTTVSRSQSVEPASDLPAAAVVPAPAPASVREALPVESSAPVSTSAVAAVPVALGVIALSLLTIAVVLVIFLVRRLRGDGSPSLISQSIDRSR